jgi:hypothetical protein
MRKQISLLDEPEIVGPASGGSITIDSASVYFKQGDLWVDTKCFTNVTVGSGQNITIIPGPITVSLT